MDNQHLDTVLKQLDALYKRIQVNKANPTGLLEDANGLATLMYNLGEFWVATKEDANRAEVAYKDAVDDEFLFLVGQGEKQGTAEVKAKQKYRELRSTLLTLQALENKLSTLRRDVDKKISVIQSYASELRAQSTYRNV